MNKQSALELLRRSKPELQARFGVIRLALFGSTSRDAVPGDIIRLPPPNATSACSYLEDLLGRPVDLITEKALRPQLHPSIKQERINV